MTSIENLSLKWSLALLVAFHSSNMYRSVFAVLALAATASAVQLKDRQSKNFVFMCLTGSYLVQLTKQPLLVHLVLGLPKRSPKYIISAAGSIFSDATGGAGSAFSAVRVMPLSLGLILLLSTHHFNRQQAELDQLFPRYILQPCIVLVLLGLICLHREHPRLTLPFLRCAYFVPSIRLRPIVHLGNIRSRRNF